METVSKPAFSQELLDAFMADIDPTVVEIGDIVVSIRNWCGADPLVRPQLRDLVVWAFAREGAGPDEADHYLAVWWEEDDDLVDPPGMLLRKEAERYRELAAEFATSGNHPKLIAKRVATLTTDAGLSEALARRFEGEG